MYHEGTEIRKDVMSVLINEGVSLNMLMNRLIANSYYFDSNTMNELSEAITHIDKAIYSLDLFMEELVKNGML